MTPAQIARRKFKSSLPRKFENRRISAMEALGETFKLYDRFRGIISEHGQDPDKTLHAALAFCLPESNPAFMGAAVLLPGHKGIGGFCDDVMKLDRPLFLGVLFLQLDPDTKNPNYKWASFCTQFMGGPEAEGRLLYARKMFVIGVEQTAKSLRR
jgi:hypothetical protein